MTCAACIRAERTPRAYDFTNGCASCKARALAATGAHEESRERGRMTKQYEGALKTLFPDDFMAGHKQVLAWSTLQTQSDQPPVQERATPRKRA